jgi:ABC-type sugar transport system permease subunit
LRLTWPERLCLFGPLTVVLSIWLVVPALLGFIATLTSYAPAQAAVKFVGLSNFQVIFADRAFAAAIRNIALFTLIAVPLQLVVGLGLAWGLRQPFRGRSVVRLLLVLPWLVSPIASGVMWRFLLGSQTGFLNFLVRFVGLPTLPSPLSQHGLALVAVVLVESWRVAPLVTFLLLPSLTAIAPERWDSALLDGLPTLSTIRHVVLPAMWPVILAVTMLLIGGALATFDSILTMTGGGPGTETMTPALYGYDKAFTFSNWPAGATSGWLVGGAVLLVGFVYLRLAARPEQ